MMSRMTLEEEDEVQDELAALQREQDRIQDKEPVVGLPSVPQAVPKVPEPVEVVPEEQEAEVQEERVAIAA